MRMDFFDRERYLALHDLSVAAGPVSPLGQSGDLYAALSAPV